MGLIVVVVENLSMELIVIENLSMELIVVESVNYVDYCCC